MVTRGFGGRQPPPDVAGRLPPGQFQTEDFPVLGRPKSARFAGRLEIHVEASRQTGGRMVLGRVQRAAAKQGDARHPLRDHLVEVRHGLGGRAGRRHAGRGRHRAADRLTCWPIPSTATTTNVPIADLVGGKAMVALQYEGKPITPDHGGPARLLVPHLYFWKSAKWMNGLQFTDARRRRLLGAARLSHLRRPVARAALHR